MKQKRHFSFSRLFPAVFAFLLFLNGIPAFAADGPGGVAYGILAYSDDQPGYANHLVSFPLQGEGKPVYTSYVGFDRTSTAGAYADGLYYVAATTMQGTKEIPDALYAMDISTGEYVKKGALTGYASLINDMSYDISTSTLYAVARIDDTVSALYTIDRNNGNSVKVATLDRRFFTLACSLEGQLYGVSFAGDFCRIDKRTGAVEVVGHTGLYPEKFQSMEFDHENKVLYWACTSRRLSETGMVELQETYMTTIDPATGATTRGRSLGDDQIAGLYVPYRLVDNGAPLGVESLEVMPAANGGASARISWTNPQRTFGGDPIKALTKVEVMRDGAIVATKTDARPGAKSEITDVLPSSAGAFHTYKVTAYTASGAGLPVETTVFVGADIPAKVEGVTVERLGANAAVVSWNPVTTGANGGWTDVATMKYNVTRMPGNVSVASGISTTSYTETGVEVSGNYYYLIEAVNSIGASGTVESEPIVLGPKIECPITEEFSEESFANWTVVDSNSDDNKWSWFNLAWAKAAGAYFMASSNEGDDWLISRPISFDGASSYKVTFTYIAAGNHTVDVALLDEYVLDTPVAEAGSVEFGSGYALATKEFTFNVAESGEYNLAFHEVSPSGRSYLLIDRITIEKLADKNLAATGISGSKTPNEGNNYIYSVRVENRGREPAEDFKVELVDQTDRVVGSRQVTEQLEAGDARIVTVQFVADAQVTELRGRVVYAADQIEADNCTEPMGITVMPAGTPEDVEIGESAGTTREHPFNLYNKYGAALEVYTADEIGLERGRIFEVRYPYSSSTYLAAPEKVGLKLYLANTDLATASGWIPLEEMTLVYDGTVDFEPGEGVLSLPLAHAFDYEGGNLAVVGMHTLENSPLTCYSGLYWNYYRCPDAGNSAYCYTSDKAFEYGSAQGRKSSYGNSVVTFMIQTGGASVAGKVTDTEGNALEGALVKVEPLHATTLSGADGTYRMDFIPNGDYTLGVQKKYYGDSEEKPFTMGDEELTVDIVLEKLPTAPVAGHVVDYAGAALGDVTVRINGYEELETVSAADGTFSFASVVCEPSVVTLTKDWYAPVTVGTDVKDAADMGSLAMGFAHYTPAEVTVKPEDNAVRVEWTAPDMPGEVVYDSGVAASQFGLTDNIGTGVMGTAFRRPMLLENIRWQTTEEGGPHDRVNIYVYDLDADGNPTGTLLFSERNVENKDGEWTEYTLAQPVSAPNGCLVMLNYPGFLGLGIDADLRANPCRENTYYYSVDYASGEFALCEKLGLDGNLLIRAGGRFYPEENTPVATVDDNRSPLPAWQKYNVYRSAGYESAETEWTLLTAEPVSVATYSDSSFASLAPGVYRYAVASVYPDGTLSALLPSGYLLNNAYADLTVPVATNSHSGDAAGATVSVYDKDGVLADSGVAGSDGRVTFTDIWKGMYDVKVTLPGYHESRQQVDLTLEDAVTTDVMTLEEIIATPVNLKLFAQEDGSLRFTWNESGEISDGFEDYDVFGAPSNDEMQWKCIDADGGRTFAEADFVFPGMTTPMSFIVFDPKQTSPSMFDQRSISHPRSGNSQLACFAAVFGNDDWLISPRLTYHTDYRFSFYARGYSATYGETIKVGYSTGGDSPEEFEWIGSEIDVAKQQWQKYEFDIPAAARYVAVRVVSEDGFTLFIDDVEIGSGLGMEANTAPTGPEVEYEVTLDGDVLGVTADAHRLIEKVGGEGLHTLGVRAIYASGRSDEATIEFGGNGIEAPSVSLFHVSPNPANGHTYLSGEFRTAYLYDLSGRNLRSYTCDGDRTLLDLAGVDVGMYLLLIDNGSRTETVKLTVR